MEDGGSPWRGLYLRDAVKGLFMRWFGFPVILMLVGGVAFGQDSPQPDQLKKMYDDVLGQLRQAQDRKNELAAENEKLNAKLADMQKQLDAATAKSDQAAREASALAEQTYVLRSHDAAWKEFIHYYPRLEARWQIFLEGDLLAPQVYSELVDSDWPLSAMTQPLQH